MIFLGPLYSPYEEAELLKNSKHGLSNATNQFQMDLLYGFIENNADLKIINVLPVGTFPRHYNKLYMKNREWSYENADCFEIGGINLPFIKQWQREHRVRKYLKKIVKEDSHIVIYSTYLPFLRAVKSLPESIKISLVIADLPEFYDLGRTSKLRTILRKINNNAIYKVMSRIDGYVLLTEQMADFLKIKDKPYTIVEGVWNKRQLSKEKSVSTAKNTEKKVIFYAGTLHEKYGIKNLLDAFALIEDSDVELWLCGTGDYEHKIVASAEKDSRIKYYGYVSSEKANQLRAEASVLVNPRTNEGEYTKYSFPSKTMGYLASGIPVVAYKLDGIPEEYNNYLNIVSGNSAEDLKNKLSDVLYDTAGVYKKRAENAVSFVETEKSAKAQALKIIELMDKLN